MSTYHCSLAKNDARTLFDLLVAKGVLQSVVHPDWLSEMFSVCPGCEKGAAQAKCLGWSIVVQPGHPLQFSMANFRGRQVRADLSISASFRRSAPASQAQWEATPLASSTIGVNLFVDGREDQPAERHHLDLAEVGQPGPAWHLQAGGNPPGYEKFETTWLKAPRWPIPPADLALACELVVMNFYGAAWDDLRQDGQWNNLIQRSEDLTISHYFRHMQAYFGKGKAGQRAGTWLDVQDSSNWQPRAA